MQLDPVRTGHLSDRYHHLKSPALDGPPAQRNPKVIDTVSQMLSAIKKGGIDQVMAYAAALDRWDGRDPELSAPDIARLIDRLPPKLRQALDVGQERTQHFAVLSRDKFADYEAEIAPGLVTGVRYVPVGRVGAYLPAGRFPLTASAFMTVNVAKVAGVPTVMACTPPQPGGGPNPAVLYAAQSPASTGYTCSAACRHWRRWPSDCWVSLRSTCSSAPATPTSPRRSVSSSAGAPSTCWRVRPK